jgi:sec-independent protein translocase protein TatC
MIGSFIFVQHYFDWLTRPVRRGLRDAGHEMNFYAKSLTEPFWVYMKLAIVGGLLISAPFIFWELWRFVAPGLYRKERRLGVLIAVATGVCFLGGAAFSYAFMCEPAAYYLTKLCTSFAGDLPFKLDTMLMMDEVANFQMMTLAGCGVAFELPVVLSILGWMGSHQQPRSAQVQQVRHRAGLRGRRRAHAEHGSVHADALGGAHLRRSTTCPSSWSG